MPVVGYIVPEGHAQYNRPGFDGQVLSAWQSGLLHSYTVPVSSQHWDLLEFPKVPAAVPFFAMSQARRPACHRQEFFLSFFSTPWIDENSCRTLSSRKNLSGRKQTPLIVLLTSSESRPLYRSVVKFSACRTLSVHTSDPV